MGTAGGLKSLLRHGDSGPTVGDGTRDAGWSMTDVVVVAPIRVHRESLSTVLDANTHIRVVGQARTLEETLPQLTDGQGAPVALLDGPPLGDLVVAAPLTIEPQAKIVALGVPESEAVAWIEAGASGFVPPDGSLGDVIVAVEKVADDELAASPQVTARLASRVRLLAAESPPSIPDGRLTTREVEVLELLAEGLSNKQIAQRLSIQLQTVKNHVHNVLVKLGVKRRAEAAARARRRQRSRGHDAPPAIQVS
jgi:two-component system, NarL family, nitrate/nitrite response regulator NarL